MGEEEIVGGGEPCLYGEGACGIGVGEAAEHGHAFGVAALIEGHGEHVGTPAGVVGGKGAGCLLAGYHGQLVDDAGIVAGGEHLGGALVVASGEGAECLRSHEGLRADGGGGHSRRGQQAPVCARPRPRFLIWRIRFHLSAD